MNELSQAQIIAQQALATIISEDPNLTDAEVNELRLTKQNDQVWVFAASIPKLIEQGWVPGAITIFVDKKDGRVWTDQEQEEFHVAQDNKRRRAGFIRRPTAITD